MGRFSAGSLRPAQSVHEGCSPFIRAFSQAPTEEALQRFEAPETFNTQGSQFTCEAFTDVLKGHAIAISMDGKGRWVDNVFVERLWRSVKYEDVYLRTIFLS